MSLRLEPCIPVDLDEQKLEEIIDKAKDWAVMHGACMRSKTNFNQDILQFAPFVLFPSSFPQKEFQKAVSLQPLVNELIHKIANNHKFLSKALSTTITVDPFTAALYKIYETVREEGVSQECCAGLFRCDYMLDRDILHQVEINTIASSFGGIATIIPQLHRYILEELGHSDKLEHLPPNTALQSLVGGMIKAWEVYNQPNSVILFIIEDVTYNICDQRFHEFGIRSQRPNIRVLRKTLTQLGRGDAILGSRKELIVDGSEVALVYFRCGYSPDQYPSPDGCEWNARLLIERSKAIKCPNIAYHLAGTKKVQQVLAKPGVLEELLDDREQIAALRESFTGLYSLDLDEEGDRATEMAIKDPERFVLKPQREGGGNNVYGKAVGEVLETLNGSSERASYILMDVIQPPLLKNWMIRPGSSPILIDTISELGIFGVILGNSEMIYHNSAGGHMLRTKLHTANEGGVAAGFGALDSPFLVAT